MLFALAWIVTTAASQTSTTAPQAAAPQPSIQSKRDWPQARAHDVDSIDSIVHAFFEAISAPAGGRLSQPRLNSLFVPDGRIAVSIPPTAAKPADVLFLTPEQYASMSDAATAKSGFFDHVLASQVEEFGVMAHVFVSYESRNNKEDPKPFVRGMKSFDLLKSGGRWFIVQVSWDRERADNPIPEKYLHDHKS